MQAEQDLLSGNRILSLKLFGGLRKEVYDSGRRTLPQGVRGVEQGFNENRLVIVGWYPGLQFGRFWNLKADRLLRLGAALSSPRVLLLQK
jgi:hypothetical protein